MHPMQPVLTVEYWRDGEWLVGRLREDPSTFSQGKTLDDLEHNLRDAYRLMHDAHIDAAYGRRFELRAAPVELT